MNKRPMIVLIVWLLVMACSFPTPKPEATSTPTLSAQNVVSTAAAKTLTAQASVPSQTLEAETQVPLNETPATPPCLAYVIAKPNVNVRSGPGQAYDVIGILTAGSSALVVGQNDAKSWWYIEFPNGSGQYGWVAASVTTPFCIPEDLQVIAAPTSAP